jgi:hypothetical protein
MSDVFLRFTPKALRLIAQGWPRERSTLGDKGGMFSYPERVVSPEWPV